MWFLSCRSATCARPTAWTQPATWVTACGANCWLPVYFYGKAASRPARERLETVRKLGFREARRTCARRRGSSRCGWPGASPDCRRLLRRRPRMHGRVQRPVGRAGRPHGKTDRPVGSSSPPEDCRVSRPWGCIWIPRGFAQVSMNLTDLGQTPVFAAFDAVCSEVRQARGDRLLGSELVGLAPRAALGADPSRLRIVGFSRSMISGRASGQGRNARGKGTIRSTLYRVHG